MRKYVSELEESLTHEREARAQVESEAAQAAARSALEIEALTQEMAQSKDYCDQQLRKKAIDVDESVAKASAVENALNLEMQKSTEQLRQLVAKKDALADQSSQKAEELAKQITINQNKHEELLAVQAAEMARRNAAMLTKQSKTFALERVALVAWLGGQVNPLTQQKLALYSWKLKAQMFKADQELDESRTQLETLQADIHLRDSPLRHGKEMQHAISRARKMFNQMDVDSNGLLQGPELVALAEWVLSSFHPGGNPLTQEEQEKESAKLLRRLDKNGDGALDFDEFVKWFERTAASAERLAAEKGLPGPFGAITAPEKPAEVGATAAAAETTETHRCLLPLHRALIHRLKDVYRALGMLGVATGSLDAPLEGSKPVDSLETSSSQLQELLDVMDADGVRAMLRDAQDVSIKSEMKELSGIAHEVQEQIERLPAQCANCTELLEENDQQLLHLTRVHALHSVALARWFRDTSATLANQVPSECPLETMYLMHWCR